MIGVTYEMASRQLQNSSPCQVIYQLFVTEATLGVVLRSLEHGKFIIYRGILKFPNWHSGLNLDIDTKYLIKPEGVQEMVK